MPIWQKAQDLPEPMFNPSECLVSVLSDDVNLQIEYSALRLANGDARQAVWLLEEIPAQEYAKFQAVKTAAAVADFWETKRR